MTVRRSAAHDVRRILVFLPSLAGGGAERVTLALASGLAAGGAEVHLVVASATGSLADDVPHNVVLHDLAVTRLLYSVRGLRRIVGTVRPDVVISALSQPNIIAALVVKVLGAPGRLVVMHHNTTSISMRQSPRRRDRVVPLLCALAYRLADRVVAVSSGVARDLARSSHLPVHRIVVLPNPIAYDAIRGCASSEPEQSTLPAGDAPLVVASGRLEPQKGFDVLLRAMAQVRAPYRLVVLGAGPLREELETLAAALGVGERVEFAGFVANPYAYLARAQVFALSSNWEGLPTVLLEALAFDVRIVATDCPSGPAEILDGVPGSELVPVQDPAAFAAAVERALRAGPVQASRPQWRAYDAPVVLDRLRDLLDDVLGERSDARV